MSSDNDWCMVVDTFSNSNNNEEIMLFDNEMYENEGQQLAVVPYMGRTCDIVQHYPDKLEITKYNGNVDKNNAIIKQSANQNNHDLYGKIQNLEEKIDQLINRISVLEIQNHVNNDSNNNNNNNNNNNDNKQCVYAFQQSPESICIKNEINTINKALTLPNCHNNNGNNKRKRKRNRQYSRVQNKQALIIAEALQMQKLKLKKTEQKKEIIDTTCDDYVKISKFVHKSAFAKELAQKVKQPRLKNVKHILLEREQRIIDPHARMLEELHKQLSKTKAKLKNVKTNVKTIIILD